MTREEIKEFSGVEPNCFETDREEDWYKIGCIDGLNAADADPDTSSLWHDASEYPAEVGVILYHTIFGSYSTINHGESGEDMWKVFVKDYGVKEWAYIKDLLPK